MTVKSFTRPVGAAAVAAIMAVGMAGCLPHDCPLHIHTFGEWAVTVEPTCETEGTRVRVCSCGDEESETIEKKAGAECEASVFIDERDGQVYRKVTIGDQTWMAQNLNWAGDNGDLGWCYDDNPANCDLYGRLYDWSMVMGFDSSCNFNTCTDQIQPFHRGICPPGWHVPSDAQWETLVDFVDDIASAVRLKAVTGWFFNTGIDDFGFSALPGGGRDSGFFWGVGTDGIWWSATDDATLNAWIRGMHSAFRAVYAYADFKIYGYSLRCLQEVRYQ